MPRWLKHVLGVFAVFTVAACSGSSGCSSCGMTPLPNGFDKNARIENAATVRLTKSGLDFIEKNIGPLAGKMMAGQGGASGGDIITFPIPESTSKGTGYSATICPGGPDEASLKCIAETQLSGMKMDLSTAQPHNLFITGTVPLRLKNLPIKGKALFIPFNLTSVLSGGGNNDCNPDNMSFADIPFSVAIEMMVDKDPAHASRQGYTKMVVSKVTVDNKAIEKSLHFCGGGLDDSIAGMLKGTLVSSMMGGLSGTLSDTINEQLCQKADPTSSQTCPGGTTPDDKQICRFSDGACASTMLGMDGHMDLGSALASISPGTTGGLDILLAAGGPGARTDNPSASWGDLNPVADGATLGLFGGALPNPKSNCVTPVQLDLPQGIPQPDELLGNTLPGWSGEGPHLGFGLSERYLNYALGSAYNSGVLCLGMTTAQVGQLTSATFGLLVPSMKMLTLQKKAAPIAMAIRPKKPPTITVGGGTDLEKDPLLLLKMDQLVIDFYVWSADRFIRAFTLQMDLSIPLGLDVSDQGITPQLDKIFVKNAVVTNAPLIKENPDTVAKSLAGLFEGLAGQLTGGAMSPIDLSSALSSVGLKLKIEKNGIRKLEKGSDRFLGVFAALEVAPTSKSLQSETKIDIVSKKFLRQGFALTTRTDNNQPTITLRASSSLSYETNGVEYSYKLDNGFWHRWTRDRDIVVKDPFLMVQGEHVIYVKSRVIGKPGTVDATPASVSVMLDVTPPRVSLSTLRSGTIRLDAWDPESNSKSLMYRVAVDQGTWSAWKPVGAAALEIPTDEQAQDVTVQVRDEEGNVATKRQGLIRGRPDSSLGTGSSSGCGCSVPGSTQRGGTSSAGWLLGLGLLAMVFGRGRKHSEKKAGKPSLSVHHSVSASKRRFGVIGSVAVMMIAGSWSGCSCSDDTQTNNTEPQKTDGPCGTPGADECVVIEQGLIGEYTSAAVAPDGTLWVAGYNEADWENNLSYGDLVVGKWNGKSVDWQIVDGLPSHPADEDVYDVNSWRDGKSDPGPDVGLWTSLAVNKAGHPMVAYLDVTNKALKFASFDGNVWSTHTVFKDDKAYAGRYAKMLVVAGKPVVAFQAITFGDAGHPVAAVKLARATKDVPSSTADWAVTDVAKDETTPCRKALCAKGQVCFDATKACAVASKDCQEKCASGTACLDGKCVTTLGTAQLDDYPDAIGDYISMAVGPKGNLGLVYYDRPHGNLWQAREQDGKWVTALLDGQTDDNPPTDTGDVGIGASLAIDAAGDWHIAYVDGFKESVKYMFVGQGTTPSAPEVVDDGAGTDDGAFADGHHVVGDDSDITVNQGGDVRISYQDATVGTLRWSVGRKKSAGDGHDWSRKVIKQDGFAGFFGQQVEVKSATKIVNWWRKSKDKFAGDVNVVSP